MQCRHILVNGQNCHAMAVRGKSYCYFHDRLHRTQAAMRKPFKKKERKIEYSFPDSPASILLSTHQVLNALGDSSIDLRRAGLTLYALQVATQNVPHNPIDIPISSVHCITQTSDGDEMAPECDHGLPCECGKCTEFEKCPVVKESAARRASRPERQTPTTMKEMFKDALLRSLSGLSNERFDLYRESLKKPITKMPTLTQTLTAGLDGQSTQQGPGDNKCWGNHQK